MTEYDNQRLTQVGPDAPMGQMMRRFWLPILRSQAVEADGAPRRVKVLGENMVVFRDTSGQLGILEEFCAHRRISLALAHNGEGGLRCIYHGWKFAADGRVLDIPTETDAARCAAITKRVRLRHYPVCETGGLIWAYLGEGTPPAPPAFEFATLDAAHVDVRAIITRANWLQTMEAILDSAHLGFLHRSTLLAATAPSQRNAVATVLFNTAPTLEIECTSYGLREAAMRTLADGTINTRIREFIAPLHVLIPGDARAERQHIMTVPIDDESSIQFVVTYNPFAPLTQEVIDKVWFDTAPTPDDIGAALPGPEQLWGQDRAAMKQGHSSGLTNRHSLCEDIATIESMGPIVDRTREFLIAIDLTIVAVRRELLASLNAVARGEPAWGEVDDSVDMRRLRSQVASLAPGRDWRQLEAFAA